MPTNTHTERFGVEIELACPNRNRSKDEAIRAIRDAGVEIIDARNRYSGSDSHSWMLKYDGSISSDASGGAEIVSPPLDFNDPEQRGQVDKVLNALQGIMQPNAKCGIHVHVDTSDLTYRQLASVGRFFYRFQDAIYRIASSGWRSVRSSAKTYAKPLPEEFARKLVAVRTESELRDAWRSCDGYGDSRYHGVNYDSWWIRRTIEFRCFNSSLNAKRVQGYIALCVAIVRDARNGNARSLASSIRLGDMKSGVIAEDRVILKLQQILRGNTDRYPAIMSAEDWKKIRFAWRDSCPQQNFMRAS